ncbi:hypothetical protein HO133_004024 [Letharia lupina]|uniref:Cytochrome b mRNA-processing protein 4 n=1 Tax=Letharia lupina TaxID=560253 RepID=A0A8H6C9L0_9LECA|nr:uncharacterized protein HO133_004024 [Letharia lupina]KAF6219555.1 hypothetical protein HO133_004024 [Letharia lupina]
MSKAALWFKMLSTGVVICVGGPALVYWVSPTEEELFKKYNPELQKRSLENREQKQQDFDNFVNKLKEYSKSDKPIWIAAAEDEARQRANIAEEQRRIAQDIQRRREKIRDESLQR